MNRLLLSLALALAFATSASAQTTIASQGFEAGDSWAITTGAGNISSATGSGDFPANQRIRTGTNSWQVSNGTATLELGSQATGGATGLSVIVRLSSTSGTSGNGADAGDNIQLSVALDGGAFPGTPDVTLSGNSNARWGYTASGSVTTSAGTDVSVQTSSGGTRADAEATLTITIPDGTTSVALRLVAFNNNVAEFWNVDDIELVGNDGTGVESATVSFSEATATTSEDATYTGSFVYTLINSDGNDGNNPAASGTVSITSGADQIQSFTTSYSFDAGTLSGTTQAFSATPVDDGVYTGDRDAVFELVATTSSASGSLTLTISDDEPAPVGALLISEIMQNPGSVTDASGEWFEIFNTTGADIDINGYRISDNGSDSHVIASSVVVPANGMVVLCNNATLATNGGVPCDYRYSSFTLSNGDDEVVLSNGATEIDRVEYDGGPNWPDPDGASMVFTGTASDDNNDFANWTEATTREREYEDGGADLGSPGATGTLQNLGETVMASTTGRFGADGVEGNGAGWRLLGVPVDGVDVDALATLNLIQGVPAGTRNGPQFPLGQDNLLVEVNAAGDDYDTATDTDRPVEPGRGFFWYWYDNNRDPDDASFGGGTSRSFENASVDLSVFGTVPATDVSQDFPYQASATNAYMIANPFDEDLATGASGLQVSGIGTGTVQADLSVWDPADGTFSTLTRDDANLLAVFQGAFVEVDSPDDAGTTATVTFLAAGRSGTATTELPARRAPDRVSLVLEGDLSTGVHIVDRAAQVRVVEGASAGWDVYDLTKLYPPPSRYALLAPTSVREGVPYRHAVYSVGTDAAGPVVVPVGFYATTGGDFTITPQGLASLPAGWTASLEDAVTGATVELTEGASYAFMADATTDWSDRFTVTLAASVTATDSDPTAVHIGEIYPNPTVAKAQVSVQVDQPQHVAITVFDAVGRRVAVAESAEFGAAESRLVALPTAGLAPGVYVVRVEGTTFAESRRLVVTR